MSPEVIKIPKLDTDDKNEAAKSLQCTVFSRLNISHRDILSRAVNVGNDVLYLMSTSVVHLSWSLGLTEATKRLLLLERRIPDEI